jgi:large subunit ribosomal protein L9
MKVILMRDVAKIGRRNEVVEVPDGYAQNQLIPKKWAQPATPVNLKNVLAKNAANSAHDVADEARFDQALASLQQERLTIAGEPNKQDHLFKAINVADIIEAATKRGVVLDKSWLDIKSQIKALGIFEVVLKRGKKMASFEVEIIKK